MTLALIKTDPLELVTVHGTPPRRIDLPGRVQVHAPLLGWGNLEYALVNVVDIVPGHNPLTQVLEGTVVVVSESEVTRTWTVRDKTAQEISSEKDSAVNGINGNHSPQMVILTDIANQLGVIRAAINTLRSGGTPAAFSAAQTKSDLTVAQVRAYIRNLLG